MDWGDPVVLVEATLAFALMARVLLLGLASVRGIVLFFLFPTVTAPVLVATHHPRIDYRLLWTALRAVEWVCMLGVTYTFLGALWSKLPGVLRFFRMTWTVSFAVVTITFMFQFEYLSAPSIGSWSFEAIVFDRVILIVAGFLVLAMLGLALWCRVAIPEKRCDRCCSSCHQLGLSDREPVHGKCLAWHGTGVSFWIRSCHLDRMHDLRTSLSV